MQDIAPLAQIKPELLQAIDEQKLLESYAQYRNLSPEIVKNEQQMAEAMEEQKQQMEQQQQIAAAPQISGALKDVAQAKQADPEGMGQLLNI
jgi:NCAIR mutase (PurE)-related protein